MITTADTVKYDTLWGGIEAVRYVGTGQQVKF